MDTILGANLETLAEKVKRLEAERLLILQTERSVVRTTNLLKQITDRSLAESHRAEWRLLDLAHRVNQDARFFLEAQRGAKDAALVQLKGVLLELEEEKKSGAVAETAVS